MNISSDQTYGTQSLESLGEQPPGKRILRERSQTTPAEGTGFEPESEPVNVGRGEAAVSALLGGGLALWGLKRGSLTGAAVALLGGGLLHRGVTRKCMLYSALGRNTAVSHHKHGVEAQQGHRATCTLHINRDADELYDFWRKLENLPQVMPHLISVTPVDDRVSRWRASGPGGKTLEWEAEIITDRRGEVIAWQSLPDSEVRTAGSVQFRSPSFGEGTELRVTLKYDPPGGWVADRIAHLFGRGLQDHLEQDLRQFKQTMETGEIATADPQPTGS